MKTAYSLTATLSLLFCSSFVNAQNYTIAQSGVATPQNKKVLLLKPATGQNNIVLFQTQMRVNTDGSPSSYHPQDPVGKVKAINNVCNAITVRKINSDSNLCFTNFSKAIQVFEHWRDTGFKTVPAGFRINWKNVLAAVNMDGTDVPCVFKTGPHLGYFGSLTALKNDLTGDLGECQLKNQVNSMTVPALVLVGGDNVVKTFGARVGDLLVAFNPKTQIVTTAIIGDTGPPDNLGEGSVNLNMKLKGETVPPTTKQEAFKLSITDVKVLVAIIPGSRTFQVQNNKPYTAENIDARIKNWLEQAGFETRAEFITLMKSFQSNLN